MVSGIFDYLVEFAYSNNSNKPEEIFLYSLMWCKETVHNNVNFMRVFYSFFSSYTLPQNHAAAIATRSFCLRIAQDACEHIVLMHCWKVKPLKKISVCLCIHNIQFGVSIVPRHSNTTKISVTTLADAAVDIFVYINALTHDVYTTLAGPSLNESKLYNSFIISRHKPKEYRYLHNNLELQNLCVNVHCFKGVRGSKTAVKMYTLVVSWW